MPERYLQALSVTDPGLEEPAATRERVKDRFPRNATRRMTQLGLLVGAALDELGPRPDDAIVYASSYAESQALEAYLDSFPTPSPTMFQTSIHPSAVQQAMIARQQPVREFFPLTGRAHLAAQAVQAALLADSPRVLLCGGEERGTWLLEKNSASARTWAFALALTRDPENALATVALEPAEGTNEGLSLEAWFDALVARRAVDAIAAPGLRLKVTWRQ